MGCWFSSIHIRKSDRVKPDDILRHLSARLEAQGFVRLPSQEEAEASLVIATRPDSEWFSIYSDWLEPGGGAFDGMTAELSTALGVEALEVACFDSDYLYINLIDAAAGIDAWAGVGSAAGLGVKRRTGLAAWRNRVKDFQRFKAGIQQKRVCAEDVLCDVGPCLGLPVELSTAVYVDVENDGFSHLYFKAPAGPEAGGPVRLVASTYSSAPWLPGESVVVDALNKGRTSRGLTVYFIGPFVEHDEITFPDVGFVRIKKWRAEFEPITLEKMQLPDGRYAYRYVDRRRRLPACPSDGMPLTAKRVDFESERKICLRFVPQGNPEKALDITVVLVPHENPEGWVSFNVWKDYGSKEAYLACREERKRLWVEHRISE